MVFGGDVLVASAAYGGNNKASGLPTIGLEGDSLDGILFAVVHAFVLRGLPPCGRIADPRKEWLPGLSSARLAGGKLEPA
jgi:hypothetical protein